MDKFYVVDGICDGICRLEDMETKEIIEIYNSMIDDLKEGDILKLVDGELVKDDTLKGKDVLKLADCLLVKGDSLKDKDDMKTIDGLLVKDDTLKEDREEELMNKFLEVKEDTSEVKGD